MTRTLNQDSQHDSRLIGLVIGLSMVAGLGCRGPHRAANAVNLPAPAVARAVDVQKLIDDAKDGELLQVPSGRYVLRTGLSIVNRTGLRIAGQEGTVILVDDVRQNVLSISGSEDIRIENVKLAHLAPLTEYECHGNVIDVRDSTNISVSACDINGCGAVGVYARNSAGVVVGGCHIHRNTFNALYLHGCRGVRIERNVIEHNANLIQAYDVDDLQMSHNVIRDNGGYWDESNVDADGLSPEGR